MCPVINNCLHSHLVGQNLSDFSGWLAVSNRLVFFFSHRWVQAPGCHHQPLPDPCCSSDAGIPEACGWCCCLREEAWWVSKEGFSLSRPIFKMPYLYTSNVLGFPPRVLVGLSPAPKGLNTSRKIPYAHSKCAFKKCIPISQLTPGLPCSGKQHYRKECPKANPAGRTEVAHLNSGI